MIPSGVRVFLASQPVDFRKGPDSLLSLVRDGATTRSAVRFMCFGRSGRTG